MNLGLQKRLRSFLQVLAYYIVPAALLVLSLANANSRLFAFFGNAALVLVVINLYIRPLALILPNSYFNFFLTLRREFGVAAVWFFLFHAGGFIYSYGLLGSKSFLDYTSFLFWGSLAAVGMIILGLTSNDYATRKLKQNWKKVQMVAYPTLFLALFHAGLASGQLRNFFVWGGIYLGLKFLQWKKVSFKFSQPN